MSNIIPPPAYTAAGLPTYTTTEVPPSSQPPILRIGSRILASPFVNTRQLKLHLDLLGAFYELRRKVEAGQDPRLPRQVGNLLPEQRWAWFVGLAVERFERWLKAVAPVRTETWAEVEAPPVDVWMVWHAYLLNPRSYAEDCSRLTIMRTLASFPHDLFLRTLEITGSLKTFRPSEARVTSWFSQTQTPFDPFEASSILMTQELQCPVCHVKVLAPYINNSGTGYAQQQFAIDCAACRFSITKERLAVAKFTHDISLDHMDEIVKSTHGYGVYMANTLRTPLKGEDMRRAQLIKNVMLNARPFRSNGGKTPKTSIEMAEAVQWSLTAIRLTPGIAVRPKLIGRVLSAYSDQRPFSVELVGAVLRQGSFVEKMQELGWTQPGYFDDPSDERALHHSIVRYHAFLDLMANSPSEFFVPTLDIDLAWHTHQLFETRYQTDCAKYVGRYVDHDDKVEESHLSNAFDLTCRAWNARFNVPYMYCGCPLPGDTIGQKLTRLVQHMSNKPYTSSELSPPELPDLLAATHPSDHNGITVQGLPSAVMQRHLRQVKLQRRRVRDSARVKDGRMDKRTYQRGVDHSPAFLYPVPMWYGIGACVGGVGNVMGSGGCGGIGGCAAGAGGGCGGGGAS
ncbi:hypothetical protein EW146_g9155, partial [Bondarzewia mesenterica]